MGAEGVVYTLDGSLPTAASPRYAEPLVLDATTVVTARGYRGEPPEVLGDAAVLRCQLVEPRLPTKVRVSFGPPGASVPEGWVRDTGAAFEVRHGEIAMGWNAACFGATRHRGKNPDPVLDTLIHFSDGAAWEIAVADGTYELTVCIGDAEYPCENQTLFAEGEPFADGINLQANAFQKVTGTVTVTDGALTLTSNDAPHGPQLARMTYLEIRRLNVPR
jgi:hypothetical protein